MNLASESSSPAVTDTGPFTIIPEWVLDADVTPAAVRLYGVLGRYSDVNGVCWPSRKALASRLRVSVDSVDRAVKELTGIGSIAVEERYSKNGDRAPNRYFVYRSKPDMRLGGRVDAATCGGTDAAGGGRVDAAVNESHAQREPVVEREPLLEERSETAATDALLTRLVKVCSGSKITVIREAPKVLSLLRQHYAEHIIDQGIGVCELLEVPPVLPRYLLKVVQETDTDQFVPDLYGRFKGGAA